MSQEPEKNLSLEVGHCSSNSAAREEQLVDVSSGSVGINITTQESPKQHSYRQRGRLDEHIVYFCSLAVATYAGLFTRVYLAELSRWNGVPLFGSLYPQMVGSAVMGFVINHKVLLSHFFLYQAITTGLCGSITAFSAWNLEAVSSLLQTGQVPPDNTARIFGWVTTLLLGFGMSTGALTIGRHLALLSPWSDSKRKNKPVLSTKRVSNLRAVEGDVFVCVWIILSMLIVVILFILERRDFVFSCLLATIGTYIRWHLSPLNSAFQSFKLGTFLANIAGSLLLGCMAYAKDQYAEGELAHDILTGMATGLCGCLTTVSTFAVELFALSAHSTRSSYIYAATSIGVAQVGLIVVKGTLQWTSS